MTADLRPYPEYKDSHGFIRPYSANQWAWTLDAPPCWPRYRLKQLGLINPSRATLCRKAAGDLVAFVPMERATAYDPRLRPDTRRYIEVSNGFTAFKDGDLLIAKITPCFENGKGGIAAGLQGGMGFASTEFHVFRPSDRVDVRFVYYATLCKPFRDVGAAQMTGSAGQQRVPSDYIANFQLPVPPLKQQKAIADYLDANAVLVRRFIHNRRRLIEVLSEQKQAIINRAVTRGLDPNAPLKPSGIDCLGDIPEHWTVVRLRRLLRGIDQGVSPQAEAGLADETSWGVLKAGCVNGGVFRPREHKRLPDSFGIDPAIVVRPGDVLVSRACGSPNLVGSVAKVTACDYRLILSDKTFRLRFKVPEMVDFFVTAMNARYFRTQVRLAISGAEGLANNLPLSSLRDFTLGVPPRDDAQDIHAVVAQQTRDLDRAITKAEREIDLIREYRTRLIADVVTGKLDVRHLAPRSEAIEEELSEAEDLGEGIDNEEMNGDDEPELVDESADNGEAQR